VYRKRHSVAEQKSHRPQQLGDLDSEIISRRNGSGGAPEFCPWLQSSRAGDGRQSSRSQHGDFGRILGRRQPRRRTRTACHAEARGAIVLQSAPILCRRRSAC